MYFHLIWIKEKNWEKYDLDILLEWWDEDLIRKFLWIRGVVIVSINEFKEDPKTFWNVVIKLTYNETEIQLVTQWEDLNERMYFFISLWLEPTFVNFVDNPVPDQEMKEMLDATFSKIKEEDLKLKQEEEEEEYKEKKKYEEWWIHDWLKMLNINIDRIEQVMKAWEWILSWSEMKKLDEYMNEMKKIRLWTNFNKMISLVLDVHILLRDAEEQIFKAYEDKKFLIDNNSYATNIDVLSEYLKFNKIYEKSKLQPAGLTFSENISSMLWTKSIFLSLLKHDMSSTLDDTSVDDFFSIVLSVVEYIVLCAIVVICLMWLFSTLVWMWNFSLYLLPAMWWLWFLLYLLNNLKLDWFISKCVAFIILAIVYWQWLNLLLNTFAL